MRTSYARLFADENGVSHFQDVDIELIPGFLPGVPGRGEGEVWRHPVRDRSHAVAKRRAESRRSTLRLTARPGR
jgi:hypothetical protein